MRFRYFPDEQHWCSFSDYGCILDVTKRLQAKRVLEFGPGSSTLALIEGGAELIDSCEDDPHWFVHYHAHLEAHFRAIVNLRPYAWDPILSIPGVDGQRYDLALIDGPRQTPLRPLVVDYCLRCCAAVLVPLECDDGSTLMREACTALAVDHGRPLEIMHTGPLAGAFALIGPPC